MFLSFLVLLYGIKNYYVIVRVHITRARQIWILLLLTLCDKAKLLDANASIKARILGGLVAQVFSKAKPSFYAIQPDNKIWTNDYETAAKHCDHELELNPTTYIEALLDEKAATLDKEIYKTLEELGNTEIIWWQTLSDDLITNPKIYDFQEVRLRLKTFQDMLVNYKIMFLKALRELITAIWGGKEKEQALEDIVPIHHNSPFKAEQLNQWLENNQGEEDLLHLYTQQMSGVPVVKYSTLFDNIVIDPSVKTVMCFCFTSLKDEDPYLSALTKYLDVDEVEKLSTTPESDDQDFQVWFQKYEVIVKMKDNHSLFKSFFFRLIKMISEPGLSLCHSHSPPVLELPFVYVETGNCWTTHLNLSQNLLHPI